LFSSRAEKKQSVIDLYREGKTIREIAKEIHMSFGDISATIKEFAGESQVQKDKKNPSKDTKAFKLFSQGKTPVEVAIKLDTGADETDRLYREYWKLRRLYKLISIYKEIEPYLSSFLKLFKIMKRNGISEQEMVNAIKYANELPNVESKVQGLRHEVRELEDKKDNYKADLRDLKDQTFYSKETLDLF
jgi:transposase